MTGPRERLRHDVGKYLTRIARNLRPGDIPPPLAALLAKDLYEAPGGGRPSLRFAELAVAIDEASAARVRAAFVELDALEPQVRAQEQAAMRRGAALALDIARAIDDARDRT